MQPTIKDRSVILIQMIAIVVGSNRGNVSTDQFFNLKEALPFVASLSCIFTVERMLSMCPGLFFKSKMLSRQELESAVKASAKRLEIKIAIIPVEVTDPRSCVLVLFLDEAARLKTPLLQLELADIAVMSFPFEITNYGLV